MISKEDDDNEVSLTFKEDDDNEVSLTSKEEDDNELSLISKNEDSLIDEKECFSIDRYLEEDSCLSDDEYNFLSNDDVLSDEDSDDEIKLSKGIKWKKIKKMIKKSGGFYHKIPKSSHIKILNKHGKIVGETNVHGNSSTFSGGGLNNIKKILEELSKK